MRESHIPTICSRRRFLEVSGSVAGGILLSPHKAFARPKRPGEDGDKDVKTSATQLGMGSVVHSNTNNTGFVEWSLHHPNIQERIKDLTSRDAWLEWGYSQITSSFQLVFGVATPADGEWRIGAAVDLGKAPEKRYSSILTTDDFSTIDKVRGEWRQGVLQGFYSFDTAGVELPFSLSNL